MRSGSWGSVPSRNGPRSGSRRRGSGRAADVGRSGRRRGGSCRGHARSGLGLADRGRCRRCLPRPGASSPARTGSPTTWSSCPSGCDLDVDESVTRISIEPAGAFGLGDHPTSQLSARALRVELARLASDGIEAARRARRGLRHRRVVDRGRCVRRSFGAGDRHLRRRRGSDRRQRPAQRGGEHDRGRRRRR